MQATGGCSESATKNRPECNASVANAQVQGKSAFVTRWTARSGLVSWHRRRAGLYELFYLPLGQGARQRAPCDRQ